MAGDLCRSRGTDRGDCLLQAGGLLGIEGHIVETVHGVTGLRFGQQVDATEHVAQGRAALSARYVHEAASMPLSDCLPTKVLTILVAFTGAVREVARMPVTVTDRFRTAAGMLQALTGGTSPRLRSTGSRSRISGRGARPPR